MSSKREFDIVLLGASGYTGQLCAEHITTHLPTNLKWAVAGRSASKLQHLVDRIKTLNSDRLEPDVLSVELTNVELDVLARRTKVLLNTVGPYHLYSTPVVEACAKNATHYLDVTGETPWVRDIVQKFHELAKANKAIIIPEIGIESAPSDLVAYAAVSKIRKAYGCGTRNVICSIHELKAAGPSGGTLATVIGLFDNYSASEIMASLDPFVLSPSPPADKGSSRSLLSRVFGPFSYPGLGIITTSMSASPNVAIVHRSSGLMPDIYGSNFKFAEYYQVSSYAMGVALHLCLMFASMLLAIKPFRMIVKKFIYQPGQGPTAEANMKDVLEYRAVAVADRAGPEKKAIGHFRYEGGLYYLTGVFLAEAAMVLLEDEDVVKDLVGGVLTPVCLGDKFVERLRKVNVQIRGDLM